MTGVGGYMVVLTFHRVSRVDWELELELDFVCVCVYVLSVHHSPLFDGSICCLFSDIWSVMDCGLFFSAWSVMKPVFLTRTQAQKREEFLLPWEGSAL